MTVPGMKLVGWHTRTSCTSSGGCSLFSNLRPYGTRARESGFRGQYSRPTNLLTIVFSTN
eukprot:scaffold296400_cov79-Cyclotella_meneghiniana.AAC.2